MAAFAEAHVPHGPSLSALDALTHPHFVERGVIRTVHDPLAGDVQIPGFPWRSTDPLPPDDYQAPRLGGANEDILVGLLGRSGEELAALEEAGIMASKPH